MNRQVTSPFVAIVLLALAGLALASPLQAHPISLTSSLINVKENGVSVELEMMVEDLVLYYEMDHDEDFYFPVKAIKEQARVHEDFLLEYFQLRDGDGHKLDGRVAEIDFSELDDKEKGVHFDNLMAYSIQYTVDYPLGSQPEFLTVSQQFGGTEPFVPAEMEVWVFHHGVRVGPIVNLSHRSAHTFPLDWELEPDEAARDLSAARQRMQERQGDDLGITSYSAVYSYVYITETEIRHELLIPLLTLERWLPLERENADFISVAEQQAARANIFAFLKEHNPVAINGTVVTPDLARLDFFGPEFRDFAQKAPERELSVYNTRAGVILSFPIEQAPRQMDFEWNYFDDQTPALRTKVYAFEDEVHDALFHPYRRTFTWESESESELEAIGIASLPAPEPPPRLILPILSLLTGCGVFLAGGAALRTSSPRRRFICAALAGVLTLAAIAVLPYARAEVPHPFQSQAPVTEEQAHIIFRALHGNVYRAFEHRDEQRIYHSLEQSVAGQLLEDLYLQIRRGLQLQEQGGAVSRVEKVERVDGRHQGASGSTGASRAFDYRSTWSVTGTVEHWGHIHTRTNQYEAVFTIEALPLGWKITGFEPLREQPLQIQTRLRN